MSATEGTTPPEPMPLTRGFLFADLRGYTDFVEAHGDAAARDLLGAYRGLVRDVIERYAGAEIRTEGDSFYVAFQSASGAVRCGLDIVAGAAAVTAREPATPLRVGVGIHAGESAVDAEGYIGLAVNIAARICAQARAGEVLVSDTVRSLARGGELTFTPRGRRQLKGISEPIALYAVSDHRVTGAPVGRSMDERRRRTALAVGGAGLAVAAALAIAAFGLTGGSRGSGDRSGSSADATAQGGAAGASASGLPGTGSGSVASLPATSAPPASPMPLPISDGLAPHVTTPPGRYRTTSFEPAMTLRLSTGWEALIDEPDVVELLRQTRSRGPSDGELSFSRSRVGYAGPCGSASTVRIGDSEDAVLDWLDSLSFLTLAAPQPVTVGGASGVRLTGTVDSTPAPCPDAPADASGWYALLRDSRGDSYLLPGSSVAFSVLDVEGRPVLMMERWTSGDQTDFEHEVAALLLTIAFE